MTIDTKSISILTKIYLKPGIYLRELARETDLSLPALKNQVDKFIKLKLVLKKKEGKTINFYLNHKNFLIVPYLYQIEFQRLAKLPRKVSNSVYDFLSILENKPLIVIIFGSYASFNYNEKSDLDLLLIFNKLKEEEIEAKARIISERYGIKIEPIYLKYSEFKKKFFDYSDRFMKNLKKDKILVVGIEYWVMLENEKA
ncbi:MAG: hypothetical protein DRP10_03610 [Candidatus Aenigmatarchaeota archaeon]|nr:MAG: hypothetical protein DRP10_03610 [Candidatus Aenigmarchaeota archaeon]